MTMYSEHPSIKFVEHCLDEGRLDDVECVPPFLGNLPTTPRLRGAASLVADIPVEMLHHARVWARVKRALRDAQRPNPYRIQRELKPDPEFLVRNMCCLLLRQLGVKCGFQWFVAGNFQHQCVVIPTRGGQESALARQHIHRPDRKFWSLAIYPVRDSRQELTVADYQIWGDSREGQLQNEPWQSHAAVVSSSIIQAYPHDCFRLASWASAKEMVDGKPSEITYDYIDYQGRAKIGALPCRKVDDSKLRPITELLSMLDGWDIDKLKAEGRLQVGGGPFGAKS